eukprot:4217771-Lingulodinium_polyedra.AAC.1
MASRLEPPAPQHRGRRPRLRQWLLRRLRRRHFSFLDGAEKRMLTGRRARGALHNGSWAFLSRATS